MVIVDTGVWITYLSGTRSLQTDWIVSESSRHETGLTDIILCEVLQGIRGDALFAATQRRLSAFTLFNCSNEALAITSARNYRYLRSRGVTIRNTIDCIIATFCIAEGHTLLHNDRDFDPFEDHLGLRVVHPQRH